MFRRKPSPRDDLRGRDKRTQSQSSTVIQQNGHRRQDSDGDLEVRNFDYGNPDHGGAGGSRARAVTSPTTDFQPQLGRNASGGGDDVESAVYVTPADTLNRSTPSSAVQQGSKPCISNPSGGSSFSESFSGSRNEMRNMQLHQLTLSQVSKRNQSGSSDNTTPAPPPANSGQRIQMMEGSDYSVPFNLLQQGSGSGGEGKRHRNRHGSHPVPPDNSECIIPICPPSSSPQSPSDRSDTTSPNSPRSNQSSEHEQQQQQPPPPPPSSQRPPDEGDYAVPWDRSRLFQNLSRGSVSNTRRPRRRDEFDDMGGMGPSRSRGGSLRDQPSPPAPLPPSRFPQQDINQVPPPPPPEESPPPPDLPYDPNRPWRNRTVSDRAPQEGSSLARSHSRPAVIAGEDIGGSRSQSMSGHVGSGRRNNPRRSSTPPVVDPSIPLEDQP